MHLYTLVCVLLLCLLSECYLLPANCLLISYTYSDILLFLCHLLRCVVTTRRLDGTYSHAHGYVTAFRAKPVTHSWEHFAQ